MEFIDERINAYKLELKRKRAELATLIDMYGDGERETELYSQCARLHVELLGVVIKDLELIKDSLVKQEKTWNSNQYLKKHSRN